MADAKNKQVVESKPAWDTFDDEKVKKAGKILPKLNPRNNADYEFKLLTVPKEVKWNNPKKNDEEEIFYVVEIFHKGTRKTLSCNQSFLFGLRLEHERHGVAYSGFVGKMVEYQKDAEGFDSVIVRM